MEKHNHSTVYAVIVASTIISIVANYFMIQKPQIDQVWGRENYKIYKEMVSNPKYAENVKQSLESQAKVLDGEQPAAPTDNQPAAEPKATGTVTQDEIASIKTDTYIVGDKSANILWVEYSDLECPFCKRQHDSGAIKNLMTKYDGKLAVVFKHYPLPFHPLAKPGALTAECIGEIGGGNKFNQFIDQVFTKGTPTTAIMEEVIKALGVDAKKIKACVDSAKYASKIDAHASEGQTKFGVNGTPGNVIINTKTGKYEVVSGAQPEANFDAAIVRLLAE